MNERTYLIFRANCIRNEGMTGDFTTYNKFAFYTTNQGERKTTIPYDEKHPSLEFLKEVVISKDFNAFDHIDPVSAQETFLTVYHDDDFKVIITYYDKYENSLYRKDHWITEDIAPEFGLSKEFVERCTKRLIQFYQQYQEAKIEDRLNLKFMQRNLLTYFRT